MGDGNTLLFFAVGFAKLTIIFMPNLRFCLIQICGFERQKVIRTTVEILCILDLNTVAM